MKRLELFNLIDQTLTLLEDNNPLYSKIQYKVNEILNELLDGADMVADINSRIKSKESLREKIIRNHFYKDYNNAQAILDNLSDLIGFLIKCRFIEDEELLFQKLKTIMTRIDQDGTYYHEAYPHFHLDLGANQPQQQKNGFTIYRIDGYYLIDNQKVNIELQIKALVNSFWGDIEHKLVYKNTNYYVYDNFMKDLLATVNATLAITNRQLHIIYEEMQKDTQKSVNLSELNFEQQISKALNDLFNKKMNNSIGFTLNVKNTSMILGHYIYIKDIQNQNNDDGLANIYTILGRLNREDIDFEHEIEMDRNFVSKDRFIHILGNYLISIINRDYDWYVFFQMLFAFEPGNNMEDFHLFLNVIKSFLVDSFWLSTKFRRLSDSQRDLLHDECLMMLANSLCEISTIKIIHNEKMTKINQAFRKYIDELETRVISYSDFMYYQGAYYEDWMKEIKKLF